MDAQAGGPALASLDDRSEIAAVLAANGIGAGREVVVLVGGAGGLDDTAAQALASLMRDVVVPIVADRDGVVVDGGTDAGVMRLIGRARAGAGATFPLVGVAAAGTVTLPGGDPPQPDAADLEPHHTHVLLVPGTEWGEEAPWIADVAGVLADGRPSVTVLVNGGSIAYQDAARSLAAGRVLVVVAGSGRTADVIADSRAHGDGDERAAPIAASPLTKVARLDDLPGVAAAILDGLGEPAGRSS